MLCKLTTLITALIIVGEALALSIGMGFLTHPNPWLTLLNTLWLIVDISGGLLLTYLIVSGTIPAHWYFYAIVAVLLLSHGYREYEYFTDNSQKFCANMPLFIMNNVKLTGLFLILIAVSIEKLNNQI